MLAFKFEDLMMMDNKTISDFNSKLQNFKTFGKLGKSKTLSQNENIWKEDGKTEKDFNSIFGVI